MTAEWLHRCWLQRSGGDPWKVSVFPFFDLHGSVRRSLVVRWDRPELYITRSRQGGLSPRSGGFRRVVECRSGLSRIKRLDVDTRVEELGRLWHFDPWWVLAESPFDSFLSTPILKKTNCVDILPSGVTSLTYDADLAAVLVMTDSGGGVQPLSFDRERQRARS